MPLKIKNQKIKGRRNKNYAILRIKEEEYTKKEHKRESEIMSRLRGRYASGIYGAENVFEFRFNLIMMCFGKRENSLPETYSTA